MKTNDSIEELTKLVRKVKAAPEPSRAKMRENLENSKLDLRKMMLVPLMNSERVINYTEKFNLCLITNVTPYLNFITQNTLIFKVLKKLKIKIILRVYHVNIKINNLKKKERVINGKTDFNNFENRG